MAETIILESGEQAVVERHAYDVNTEDTITATAEVAEVDGVAPGSQPSWFQWATEDLGVVDGKRTEKLTMTIDAATAKHDQGVSEFKVLLTATDQHGASGTKVLTFTLAETLPEPVVGAANTYWVYSVTPGPLEVALISDIDNTRTTLHTDFDNRAVYYEGRFYFRDDPGGNWRLCSIAEDGTDFQTHASSVEGQGASKLLAGGGKLLMRFGTKGYVYESHPSFGTERLLYSGHGRNLAGVASDGNSFFSEEGGYVYERSMSDASAINQSEFLTSGRRHGAWLDPGSQQVYTLLQPGGTGTPMGLYVYNGDLSETTKLVEPFGGNNLMFDPDGGFIYYVEDDTLYRMKYDGSEVTMMHESYSSNQFAGAGVF